MKTKLDPIKEFNEAINAKNDTELFQAWVDRELLAKVKAKRRTDEISWRHLIEACFNLYLNAGKK